MWVRSALLHIRAQHEGLTCKCSIWSLMSAIRGETTIVTLVVAIAPGKWNMRDLPEPREIVIRVNYISLYKQSRIKFYPWAWIRIRHDSHWKIARIWLHPLGEPNETPRSQSTESMHHDNRAMRPAKKRRKKATSFSSWTTSRTPVMDGCQCWLDICSRIEETVDDLKKFSCLCSF